MFKIIQNLRYEFDNSEFTGKLKDVTLVNGPRSHIFGEVSLFKMLRQLGYLVKKTNSESTCAPYGSSKYVNSNFLVELHTYSNANS